MSDVILYPTETIYGLGVNVFSPTALKILFELKGRDESQTSSWLVRDISDIEKYAELPPKAVKIAEQFLPGQLTLVLRAKDTVPPLRSAPDNTVGIRISSDPVAQKIISEYMQEHDVPLTCTSANLHGFKTEDTPEKILAQFGVNADKITKVVDDGSRQGEPSTVVRVIDDCVEVLREGVILEKDIFDVVK